VQLADGRVVTGVVDDATTSEVLWLRSTEPGIVIQSGFPAGGIAQITSQGEALDAREFLGRAAETASALSEEFWSTYWAVTLPAGWPHAAAVAPCGMASIAPGPFFPTRVAAVRIEARAANWDADPETDGLLVEVIPLDAFGRLIPANGSLTLSLYGRAVQYFTGQRRDREAAFPEIARASFPVQPPDFLAGPAVYKLPYRGLHPESKFGVAWYGLVNARLSVPGAGTFSASDDTVSLRASSWMRDAHQTQRGSRYLPAETARIVPDR
jgi:hypothetical protein